MEKLMYSILNIKVDTSVLKKLQLLRSENILGRYGITAYIDNPIFGTILCPVFRSRSIHRESPCMFFLYIENVFTFHIVFCLVVAKLNHIWVNTIRTRGHPKRNEKKETRKTLKQLRCKFPIKGGMDSNWSRKNINQAERDAPIGKQLISHTQTAPSTGCAKLICRFFRPFVRMNANSDEAARLSDAD